MNQPKLIIGISTLVLILLMIFLYQYYGRSWERALFLDPIHTINSSEKVVALTFDDGPSATRTPALLDVLDKHQVKGSFFLLGQQIEAHPEIAKDIVSRGHFVANHSYSHPRMIFKTPAQMKSEILTTQKLLEDIGAKQTNYFRPPYTNKFIVLPYVLRSLNINLVTGSYDPIAQYQSPFPEKQVIDQVMQNVQPGSIIYLHDGHNSSPQAFTTAVDQVITQLKLQGYQFVTVDY